MPMESKDLGTLGVATAGLLLGIYNAWKAWRADQVNLAMKLLWGQFHGGGESTVPAKAIIPTAYLAVEVTNKSNFPVTIKEIGVKVVDSEKIFTDERIRLPVTIPARSHHVFKFDIDYHKSSSFAAATEVIAITSCGNTIKTSEKLSKMKNRDEAQILVDVQQGKFDSISTSPFS